MLQELLHNIGIVGTLVVLEGLLSADNALVLAVLVKHLPKNEQKRALRYGIFGAFLFRFIGLVSVTWLIRYWQFKAFGAGYLLYLTIKHFVKKYNNSNSGGRNVSAAGFWKTVLAVELADIAFSIDSIVAAVAMSPKLWVVYTGGILGIITMRFVAGGFLRALERFPKLEAAAYLLVGWIGIKLALESLHQMRAGTVGHVIPIWIFWSVMAAIFVGGLLWPGGKGAIAEHGDDIRKVEKAEGELLQSRQDKTK